MPRLWNCERIRVCCLMPPGWWSFVTATLGDPHWLTPGSTLAPPCSRPELRPELWEGVAPSLSWRRTGTPCVFVHSNRELGLAFSCAFHLIAASSEIPAPLGRPEGRILPICQTWNPGSEPRSWENALRVPKLQTRVRNWWS